MSHRSQRHVAAAMRDGLWIEANLSRVLSALAAQTPTGWPTGGGNGRGDTHSGGPTANAAVSGMPMRERYWRIEALSLHMRDAARALADELEAVRDLAGTDDAVRAARCTGGEGEWADPTCQRNAVQAGLCDACRKRRDRRRAKERAEACVHCSGEGEIVDSHGELSPCVCQATRAS